MSGRSQSLLYGSEVWLGGVGRGTLCLGRFGRCSKGFWERAMGRTCPHGCPAPGF